MKKFIKELLLKLLLVIVIGMILLSLGFSYSPFSKYNEYIGKEVKIETLTNIYVGKLIDIFSMSTCEQEDGFGHCISERYYHTLILKQGDATKFISEDIVNNIEEING